MDRNSAGATGRVMGLTTPRDERIRVFYLSYTPPVPSWGGAMSFYRHFVERTDFEIFVATDNGSMYRSGSRECSTRGYTNGFGITIN